MGAALDTTITLGLAQCTLDTEYDEHTKCQLPKKIINKDSDGDLVELELNHSISQGSITRKEKLLKDT